MPHLLSTGHSQRSEPHWSIRCPTWDSTEPWVRLYELAWWSKCTILWIYQRKTNRTKDSGLHGLPRFTTVFHGLPHQSDMVNHDFPWFPIVFPWFPMVFPWFSHLLIFRLQHDRATSASSQGASAMLSAATRDGWAKASERGTLQNPRRGPIFCFNKSLILSK